MATIREVRGGRVSYDTLPVLVKVRDRLVPETIVVDLDGDGVQPSVRLTIEVRQGVPVCAELRLAARPGGREIRPKDLRDVRIDSWTEQAVALCSHTQDEPGGVAHLSATVPADRENVQQARRGTVRRSGRPTVPSERLRRAADLYLRHADSGRPVQVVADVLGVSARTAARYVEKCRSDGLLPPRGKASAR